MEGRLSVTLNQGVIRLLLLLVLLGGTGRFVWLNQRPLADDAGAAVTTTESFFANRSIKISTSREGEIKVGLNTVADTIIRRPNSDELRVEILNGRKQPILGGYDIIVELTSAVALPPAASMRAYGIHGAVLVSAEPERLTDNMARWTLAQLDSEGAVSLVVSYPPGSYQLGTRALVRSLPQIIDWWQALLSGLTILLLAVIAMTAAHAPWQTKSRPGGSLSSPPSSLSPGAAGSLVRGQAGPAQLAATLVAMASRGDIQIVQSPAGYRVARRRVIPTLSITEQILLDELRIGLKVVASQEHVEASLAQQLFNKKIAVAYGGLLDELRQRGFFPRDHGTGRTWYRFVALCLTLIAVIGGTLTTMYIPEGVQLIGFWIGPLLAGWYIFARLPALPHLNSVGQAERGRWLEFRNWLADPRPLGGGQSEARAFLAYLPYAISFDVVGAWLNRFNRDLIEIPNWYFNTDNPAASKVFIEDILTISHQIARDFTKVATSE